MPSSSSSSRPRAAEVEANGEEAADASESRFAGELDARAAAAAVECRSSAIASAGGAVRDEVGVYLSRSRASILDPTAVSGQVIPDLGTESRGNRAFHLAMEVG